MKTFNFTILFIFLSSLSYAHFFTEDFNYPVGDSITSHGWAIKSGGTTNAIKVTTPGGLTFPGYSGSGIVMLFL